MYNKFSYMMVTSVKGDKNTMKWWHQRALYVSTKHYLLSHGDISMPCVISGGWLITSGRMDSAGSRTGGQIPLLLAVVLWHKSDDVSTSKEGKGRLTTQGISNKPITVNRTNISWGEVGQCRQGL
mmetsp:Transcript_8659/g.14708  ORF Transcript_8659/g.14708 Transcript_8659/m.14708 type:complete len:125 (+) Transcript_8659:236-610(+)